LTIPDYLTISDHRLGSFPIKKQVFHNVPTSVFSNEVPTPSVQRGQTQIPSPLEIIKNEEEFLVEKILDSKMFREWLKFKIKWEDYSPEHNSCLSHNFATIPFQPIYFKTVLKGRID
jgi:hypothetical protein